MHWFLSPKTNKVKNISKLFLETKTQHCNKLRNIFLPPPGSLGYVYDRYVSRMMQVILPPFVGTGL